MNTELNVCAPASVWRLAGSLSTCLCLYQYLQTVIVLIVILLLRAVHFCYLIVAADTSSSINSTLDRWEKALLRQINPESTLMCLIAQLHTCL